MKKTLLLLIATVLFGNVRKSDASVSVDSVYIITNTNNSQTIVVQNTTATGGYESVVRDTSSQFTNPVTVRPVILVDTGTTTDTATSSGLLANTTYYYKAKIVDLSLSNVDSMIFSATTLPSPPTPANLSNLRKIEWIDSVRIIVDYDAGASLAIIQYQKSINGGSTWTNVTSHFWLSGTGSDSITIAQTPATTAMYKVSGWNQAFTTVVDSGIISATTLAPLAQAPQIDSTSITGIDPIGALVTFFIHSDSIGSTVVVHQSSDNFVSSSSYVNAVGLPAGVYPIGFQITGYGPGTNVWVKMVIQNQIGIDSVIVSFTTTTTTAGPPTMTITSHSVSGRSVTINATYVSLDPSTYGGFEIFEVGGSGSIANSGTDPLAPSNGTVTFTKTISIPTLYTDTVFEFWGWIYSSLGFMQTVRDTVHLPSATAVIEVTAIREEYTRPHKIEVYDRIGRLITSSIVSDERIYMRENPDGLPDGLYIIRSNENGSRRFNPTISF